MREILTDINEETNNNTTVVDFSTPLISMDGSPREKIIMLTEVLNDITNQLDVIGIYKTLHPKAAEYTFFSRIHVTLSQDKSHARPQVSLNNPKRTEIV